MYGSRRLVGSSVSEREKKTKKKKTSRDIINYNITRMSIARYYYNNIYILHYPNGFSTETYYA